MNSVTGFFRRNGKVIPIRSSSGEHQQKGNIHDQGNSAHTAAVHKLNQAAAGVRHAGETAKIHINVGLEALGSNVRLPVEPIKVNRKLDIAGLGLSIASGLVGAATFSGGSKKFIAGLAGSHILDAAGIGANIAAVAGKGRLKERSKLAAQNEFRNFAIGNAVFGVGLLASSKNRQAIKSFAGIAAAMGKKALRII